jgi:hypothetical protein
LEEPGVAARVVRVGSEAGLASRDRDRLVRTSRGAPAACRASDELFDLPGPVAPVVRTDAMRDLAGGARDGGRSRRQDRRADECRAEGTVYGSTSDHDGFHPRGGRRLATGPCRLARAARTTRGRSWVVDHLLVSGARNDLTTSRAPVPARPGAEPPSVTGRDGPEVQSEGGPDGSVRERRFDGTNPLRHGAKPDDRRSCLRAQVGPPVR